jgi:hypothetical protein
MSANPVTVRPVTRGLCDEHVEHMERKATNIDCELRMAEQSYGTDHLDWF